MRANGEAQNHVTTVHHPANACHMSFVSPTKTSLGNMLFLLLQSSRITHADLEYRRELLNAASVDHLCKVLREVDYPLTGS